MGTGDAWNDDELIFVLFSVFFVMVGFMRDRAQKVNWPTVNEVGLSGRATSIRNCEAFAKRDCDGQIEFRNGAQLTGGRLARTDGQPEPDAVTDRR